jgi:hypothetical protein
MPDHDGTVPAEQHTIAVMVARLEVTAATLLEELRDISARLRTVEQVGGQTGSVVASLTARVEALEVWRRDSESRRPTWWSIVAGIAGIVAILVGTFALGAQIYSP